MTELQTVTAFWEGQITYQCILAKRVKGDFLLEEQIVSADYGGSYSTSVSASSLSCSDKRYIVSGSKASSNMVKSEIKPAILYSDSICKVPYCDGLIHNEIIMGIGPKF